MHICVLELLYMSYCCSKHLVRDIARHSSEKQLWQYSGEKLLPDKPGSLTYSCRQANADAEIKFQVSRLHHWVFGHRRSDNCQVEVLLSTVMHS